MTLARSANVPARIDRSSPWQSLLISVALCAMTRIVLAGVAAFSFAEAGRHVPWASMWVQWDANIYLSVVEHGYMPPVAATGFETGQSNLNFFPLAPLGIMLVHVLVPRAVMAGLVFANACTVMAGFVLHRLALLRLGREAADWSVLSFYVLPGSFIFSAPMSESPYVLLSAGAALLAARERSGLAAIAASCLSITRLTGILYGVGLVLDWMVERRNGQRRHVRELLWFCAIPIPLLCFMAAMLRLTGDALAPLHSQQVFWHQRAGIPLQNLFLFFWSRQPRLQLQGAVGLLETVVMLSIVRKLTWGERLFAGLSILSFTSTFSASESLLRYMIGLYPLHVAFGRLCARSVVGRGGLMALAMLNGALMVSWAHGSNVLV